MWKLQYRHFKPGAPWLWNFNLCEGSFAALVEPERDRGTVGADLSHFVRPGVFERGDRVIISTFGGHTCHPTGSWSPKYHLIWPHASWHHYFQLLTILICCFLSIFCKPLHDISLKRFYSMHSRPSLMIIVSLTQFHIYLPSGQCPFSIVS